MLALEFFKDGFGQGAATIVEMKFKFTINAVVALESDSSLLQSCAYYRKTWS